MRDFFRLLRAGESGNDDLWKTVTETVSLNALVPAAVAAPGKPSV